MNEMVNRRNTGLGVAQFEQVNGVATVDSLLDGYYMPGPERKHKSPTRRLIQHKNSAWDHKKKI